MMAKEWVAWWRRVARLHRAGRKSEAYELARALTVLKRHATLVENRAMSPLFPTVQKTLRKLVSVE